MDHYFKGKIDLAAQIVEFLDNYGASTGVPRSFGEIDPRFSEIMEAMWKSKCKFRTRQFMRQKEREQWDGMLQPKVTDSALSWTDEAVDSSEILKQMEAARKALATSPPVPGSFWDYSKILEPKLGPVKDVAEFRSRYGYEGTMVTASTPARRMYGNWETDKDPMKELEEKVKNFKLR